MQMAKSPKWSRRHTVLSLVAAAGLVTNLIIYGVWARMYCKLNSRKLQTVAIMAVDAGVVYLPADSRAAVKAAKESVRRSGVTRVQILFAGASPDSRTLTIQLSRKMPWYVTIVADVPSDEIRAAASAHARGTGPVLRRLRTRSVFIRGNLAGSDSKTALETADIRRPNVWA
jgi:hypothetical protein